MALDAAQLSEQGYLEDRVGEERLIGRGRGGSDYRNMIDRLDSQALIDYYNETGTSLILS